MDGGGPDPLGRFGESGGRTGVLALPEASSRATRVNVGVCSVAQLSDFAAPWTVALEALCP